MIYNVLPGDAQVEEFRKSGIAGDIIVFREALISGPIAADTLDQFFEQRARFVLGEYGEDEIVYHEKVADEILKLGDLAATDEVHLWFEYELFCSVNYWFCLYLLAGNGAVVYRIEPRGLGEDDRWDGFGKFTAADLIASFELRTKLTTDDIDLGAALWQAFAASDHTRLNELSKTRSSAFPYLIEIAAAAIDQEFRPIEVLRDITAGGEAEFANIFAEFRERAGIYGYGDLQVQRLLDSIDV